MVGHGVLDEVEVAQGRGQVAVKLQEELPDLLFAQAIRGGSVAFGQSPDPSHVDLDGASGPPRECQMIDEPLPQRGSLQFRISDLVIRESYQDRTPSPSRFRSRLRLCRIGLVQRPA